MKMESGGEKMKASIGIKDMVFPTPVFIVGTYCEDGKPNAMNVAWGGICSSNPPCISIAIRRHRCTYENILKRKAFTVSIPSVEYVKEADYFGMVSGKTADKFAATGLTPVKGDLVDAPYIKEFPFNVECKVIEIFQIGEHAQIIGEIMDIKVDENCLGENGMPAIELIKPMAFDPAASNYNAIGGVVEKAFSVGKVFSVSQK
jgi:flavin reductase (DIM6/NTAB) family NADH-FMN oxidoreductase RutF